jgi:hypothetical protein
MILSLAILWAKYVLLFAILYTAVLAGMMLGAYIFDNAPNAYRKVRDYAKFGFVTAKAAYQEARSKRSATVHPLRTA